MNIVYSAFRGHFSDSPREDLRAYVGTYLKEEIAAEALTRSVPAFSRFLEQRRQTVSPSPLNMRVVSLSTCPPRAAKHATASMTSP